MVDEGEFSNAVDLAQSVGHAEWGLTAVAGPVRRKFTRNSRTKAQVSAERRPASIDAAKRHAMKAEEPPENYQGAQDWAGIGRAWRIVQQRPRYSGVVSVSRSREQDEITVGVLDDEIPGAPRLLLEGLMELHPGGLEVEEQLFDLRHGIDLYRAR
jgi:hypothetical protein